MSGSSCSRSPHRLHLCVCDFWIFLLVVLHVCIVVRWDMWAAVLARLVDRFACTISDQVLRHCIESVVFDNHVCVVFSLVTVMGTGTFIFWRATTSSWIWWYSEQFGGRGWDACAFIRCSSLRFKLNRIHERRVNLGQFHMLSPRMCRITSGHYSVLEAMVVAWFWAVTKLFVLNRTDRPIVILGCERNFVNVNFSQWHSEHNIQIWSPHCQRWWPWYLPHWFLGFGDRTGPFSWKDWKMELTPKRVGKYVETWNLDYLLHKVWKTSIVAYRKQVFKSCAAENFQNHKLPEKNLFRRPETSKYSDIKQGLAPRVKNIKIYRKYTWIEKVRHHSRRAKVRSW